MRWRKTARLAIGLFAVAFAIWVALAFKRRQPPATTPPTVAQTDPNAVVESTGGRLVRYKGTHEDVVVAFQRQLTYQNGATRLTGVTVTTQPKSGGRSFVITGKEGQVGDNQSTIKLDGDVRLKASDGLTAATEHASYVDAQGIVDAPGPGTFTQGRLSGSGIGLTYDKNRDMLTVANQAVVHQAADAHGAGELSISAGGATIARKENYIRFDRGMHLARGGQTIEADNGVATLSADGKHIQSLDLHSGAHIGGATGDASGGLKALTAHDMTLQYAPGGEALQHVTAVGDASIELAGGRGQGDRKILANTIDVALGADGSTLTALTAQGSVQVSLPSAGATRTMTADLFTQSGENGGAPKRGHFSGNVRYREQGTAGYRAVNAASADLAFAADSNDIDRAEFSHNVHVATDRVEATAAVASYLPRDGAFKLSGSEAGAPVPHFATERISVDAKAIDVTLTGPKVKASGNVKSVLQPPKKDAKSGAKDDAKMPAMLKQDQPVNVTGADLDYDGTASHAVYSGKAQLWQGETTVKGTTITIDDKSGNLAATAPVATTAIFEQVNSKTQKKDRVRSVASAKDFQYDDAARRATYTGEVHMSGPQGDVTADRIVLFMKPSGDELDHAEAYDHVTIREPDRTTTGAHMTYLADLERYDVTGTPVKVVDSCGRETVGKTLRFFKSTDTIVVDGSERNRTQTKGGQNCK